MSEPQDWAVQAREIVAEWLRADFHGPEGMPGAAMLERLLEARLSAAHASGRRAGLEALMPIVNAQADDESLWSLPVNGLQRMSEACLQSALRQLHAAIESALAGAPPREGA